MEERGTKFLNIGLVRDVDNAVFIMGMTLASSSVATRRVTMASLMPTITTKPKPTLADNRRIPFQAIPCDAMVACCGEDEKSD